MSIWGCLLPLIHQHLSGLYASATVGSIRFYPAAIRQKNLCSALLNQLYCLQPVETLEVLMRITEPRRVRRNKS